MGLTNIVSNFEAIFNEWILWILAETHDLKNLVGKVKWYYQIHIVDGSFKDFQNPLDPIMRVKVGF